MSELKKMTVVIKNYDVQALSDLDALYGRVRLEDEHGKTRYFKEVVMLKYLKGHGAMVLDTPRVWYYKHTSKTSIIVVAVQKGNGKVEYDLDDIRLIARSTVLKGILVSIAAIPMGVIAATATFGVGLVIIPMCFWYGYRNVFKLPKMLSRKALVNELSAFGVSVQ
ncbi:hypothetical protein [Pseudomonas qingdaonensis]|uniref:hypothetical protein n=1 Tax=Pseudomonas qingdaonensis TaxID=2056231 RepID=UPI0028A73487|nr:hypothetical protein [Pseudomonas qingdaonensis]